MDLFMKMCRKKLHSYYEIEHPRRCPECKRLSGRAWAKANPEKVNAAARACRKKNPEKYSGYVKKWKNTNLDKVKTSNKIRRKKNKEKHRVKQKAWRKNNLEKEKAIAKKSRIKHKERRYADNKKWQKNNPDKCNALNAKRHAAKLQRTPPWLTKKQYKEIEEFYVLAKELQWLSEEPLQVDHIVPLQGKKVSGLHVPWNLQILPRSINYSKHNKFA